MNNEFSHDTHKLTQTFTKKHYKTINSKIFININLSWTLEKSLITYSIVYSTIFEMIQIIIVAHRISQFGRLSHCIDAS